MKKRLFSLLVTMVMVFSILPVSSQATNVNSASESNIIPQNVAEIIALYFLRDAVLLPGISWNSSTEISSCEIMYNTIGNISAYSFELSTGTVDSGYIVISAYPDVPNVILEFSDEATPLYDSLNLQPGDTIIYTGMLNYYKDDGSPLLQTVDNERIAISEIPTPLESSRSVSNLSIMPQSKYPIEDPYEWADTYYDGPFVYSGESINEFENYCHFRRTSNFSGYYNNCAPTAITNLIEMLGEYHSYSKIENDTYQKIYKNVATYGINEGYYVNDEKNGTTYWSTLNEYIEGAFDLYDLTATVTSKTATLNNIKTELTNHRPFYLTLYSHPEYGNHGVTGYAYTRLISETTGYYLSFLKIADGWASYGRYLDITSIDESDQAELRAIRIRW